MLLIISSTPLSLGHSFSSNESAAFLALVKAIKTEAQLVLENLANNNTALASEHANRASALITASVHGRIAESNLTLADDLSNVLSTLKSSTESSSDASTASDIDIVISDLDAIIDGIIAARIDPDQLDNSTIQALTIVELLDRVLINYGDAYEVGFDMTNMSMANTSATEGFELVNITSYQTAQVLATKVQELFNSQLSNSSADTQSLDNIATALQELVSTMYNRGSPNDAMMIVHTKIHPNFITAFGLEFRT